MTARPRLTVVGSINLDLVAQAERLPRVGETVSGASFSRVPGGKGANQAVAAARLGAEVAMVGCVGSDELAEPALAGLREAGIEQRWILKDAPTGIALITVDATGETTIVVAPGANAELRPEDLALRDSEAVLCQQEIPVETVARASELAARFYLNAAPARSGAPEAELTVVNQPELEVTGVTTVAGNQTLDKTTRNALVTLEVAGRADVPVAAGADAPLRRELRTAAHVHGETGLDGPELPEPSAQALATHAADFL